MARNLTLHQNHPNETMPPLRHRLRSLRPRPSLVGHILFQNEILPSGGKTRHAILHNEHHPIARQPGRKLHLETHRPAQNNGLHSPALRAMVISHPFTLQRLSSRDLPGLEIEYLKHGSSASTGLPSGSGLTAREDGSHGCRECSQDVKSECRTECDGLVGWRGEILDRVPGGGVHEGVL